MNNDFTTIDSNTLVMKVAWKNEIISTIVPNQFLNQIDQYKWHFVKKLGYFIAYAGMTNGKQEMIYLHVFLADLAYGIPDGHHVHHRDHDKSNNMPNNLQVLTKKAHREIHRQQGRKGGKSGIQNISYLKNNFGDEYFLIRVYELDSEGNRKLKKTYLPISTERSSVLGMRDAERKRVGLGEATDDEEKKAEFLAGKKFWE